MAAKPILYVVEFKGPKGWEIGHEGDNFEQALAYMEELILDVRIGSTEITGARLTAETD